MVKESFNSAAPGNRRHNGNVITVFQGRSFLLQIPNVLIIQIKVNERSQLAVLGIEMFAQLGMLGDQGVHRLADRRSRNVYRSLLADVLA